MAKSTLEAMIQIQLRASKIEGWIPEYRFHPERRWRLDLAFTEQRLGVELEGGTFIKGAHSTGLGIRRDIEKSNALTLLGWRLLRFDASMVKSGEALETIKAALKP